MAIIDDIPTTVDDFLGGRVRLMQCAEGLRATTDSVLVAAAVPAQTGETVLDVGTGNGVIPMCINARVPGLKMVGVDCQPEQLFLARQNTRLNHCDMERVMSNIKNRPSPIHGRLFHHVVTNPPFYHEPQPRQNEQETIAYHQQVPLWMWLRFCLRHIRAKGSLTLIYRPEALPDILAVMRGRLGGIEIIPVLSKENEPAKRVILRGWMNKKSPLVIRPPVIMHQKNGHYTRTAERLLRTGRSLDTVLGDV